MSARRKSAAAARRSSGPNTRAEATQQAACAYPPIADYGLIGDCHSAALVSRAGSIDWCCLPRFDSDSCFGRLLDWKRGGYFEITPVGSYRTQREYLHDTLILVTTFRSSSGEARLIDFFAMRAGGRERPRRELVRIIDGIRGKLSFDVTIVPRLDFGEVKPWIYPAGDNAHFAVGSNTGLWIFAEAPLCLAGDHDLRGRVEVRRGSRCHFALQFFPPEEADGANVRVLVATDLKAHFEETLQWWREWTSKIVYKGDGGASVLRSAVVLKALSYAPTGAIIAAPTTSLPEHVGGERNWDYRFCWIRDSIFTVHALGNLGAEAEAAGVRRFIQRSAAGNADELQVLYAVDGKRRLTEITLENLEGWRGSKPVRIGNAAQEQFQADMYGLIVELSWRWSQRGERPEPHYWDFLLEIVEAAIANWQLPDRGIWEVRSAPRHFVHSKVMCWGAVDGGIALAERYSLSAPLDRWRQERDRMRQDIEQHGYDRRRGIFVRSYGSHELDAALLLIPLVEFVPFDDERMIRTTDAIRSQLLRNGLLMRYRSVDGISEPEGVFLCCTFWLAECLARQGRRAEARQTFGRACACANDLGLFSEEYQDSSQQMLGNFPQGLTHLAHISAALALDETARTPGREVRRNGRSERKRTPRRRPVRA